MIEIKLKIQNAAPRAIFDARSLKAFIWHSFIKNALIWTKLTAFWSSRWGEYCEGIEFVAFHYGRLVNKHAYWLSIFALNRSQMGECYPASLHYYSNLIDYLTQTQTSKSALSHVQPFLREALCTVDVTPIVVFLNILWIELPNTSWVTIRRLQRNGELEIWIYDLSSGKQWVYISMRCRCSTRTNRSKMHNSKLMLGLRSVVNFLVSKSNANDFFISYNV